MKVLHIPFCFYPDPVGGTEIYVASLVRAQQKLNLDVAVAAPAAENQTYLYEGTDVYRFRTNSKLNLRDLYGEGDEEAARCFADILNLCRPNIVHIHAFTCAVSLKLVRIAKEHRVPVVFTYHTPTTTCTRGTLLQWGQTVCDGRMDARRCARCTLHGKGVPRLVSWGLGGIPVWLSARAGKAGLSGGAWTAVRMRELVSLRHEAAKALLTEVDHVVAVCEWVRDLLVRNGVPAAKITLSRQGLPNPVFSAAGLSNRLPAGPVRFVFIGRLDSVKGVGILIDALLRLPNLAASLDIYAVVQGQAAAEMKRALERKASHDRRIRFLPALAASEVVERLRRYDALLVPSQGLETGPLVVYEAFAAGIPVVGSDLGGISELVRDEETGILVEPRSLSAWTGTIARIADNPTLLDNLKAGIGPVRMMERSAEEMCDLYVKIVAQKSTSAVAH